MGIDQNLPLLGPACPKVLNVKTIGSDQEFCNIIAGLKILGYKMSVVVSSVRQWFFPLMYYVGCVCASLRGLDRDFSV